MKFLLMSIFILIVVVAYLSIYLSPNDLSSCEDAPNPESQECAPADVIVAVSGGDTNARVDHATKLYQKGWASMVIFSGAALDKEGPSNAVAMRQRAVAAGVPSSAIIIEEESETTRQNAEMTQEIVSKNNFNRVILVTSAYHQRRASLEFGKSASASGAEIINSPVTVDNQWSGWWWTTPVGWNLALGEFFRVIAFYLGGTR